MWHSAPSSLRPASSSVSGPSARLPQGCFARSTSRRLAIIRVAFAKSSARRLLRSRLGVILRRKEAEQEVLQVRAPSVSSRPCLLPLAELGTLAELPARALTELPALAERVELATLTNGRSVARLATTGGQGALGWSAAGGRGGVGRARIPGSSTCCIARVPCRQSCWRWRWASGTRLFGGGRRRRW